MPEQSITIEFSAQVREELASGIRAQLSIELAQVFQSVESTRVPTSIFVPRLFSVYKPDFDVKVVLAVEVTHAEGDERHIVKVGRRDKVESDFSGWQDCTQGRMVASRIFAPVRQVALDGERVAVVYRDAFSLLALIRSNATKRI